MASGHSLTDVIDDTGRAICGSLLTTGFGFGAMMLAEHPGLNSLGALAVVGLTVNLLVRWPLTKLVSACAARLRYRAGGR